MSLDEHHRLMRRRQLQSSLFTSVCLAAMLTCVVLLCLLVASVVVEGIPRLNWRFLTNLPSRLPEQAGIRTALAGSLWLIGMTALMALPVGVGAAIYLEEYASASRWKSLIQLNIANLAGVPSIVYGILGLGLFVHAMAFGRSVLTGALTLTLVILPMLILATQEALRAVPVSIRRAALALGATRWQTIWHQVLPAALPGIMTGIILSISRALGEAAPLVAVGAIAYVPFVPQSLADPYTALPIQIFNWSARPQGDFHELAGAAIIVLLIVLISMNAMAVFVRWHYGRSPRW